VPYALPAVCLDISSAEAQLGQVHATLAKILQRPNQDIWKKFTPDGALDDTTDVHNVFKHHGIFSEIMEMNYEDVRNINCDGADARDVFG